VSRLLDLGVKAHERPPEWPVGSGECNEELEIVKKELDL
jgi:hypothetical protein